MQIFSRLLWPLVQNRLSPKARPYRANIAVTKECHSHCKHCLSWQTSRSREEELTLHEYQQIAKAYPYLRWISLTGGEPTDRHDLHKIVEIFHQACPLYMVNFSTNGLNPKRVIRAAESIAKLGIPKFIVAVSVDGPPAVHDHVRGTPNSFSLAIQTFSALLELENRLRKDASSSTQMSTFISTTLFPENSEFIQELLGLLNAVPGFNIERLHLNLGHASSILYGNAQQSYALAPIQHAIIHALNERKFSFTFRELIERTYQTLAIQYCQHNRSPIPCTAIRSSFFLNEHGQVYPCTIWDVPIGNVRDFDYSIESTLNTPIATKAKIASAQQTCPSCWSPCESYQRIAFYPFQSLRQAIFRR